MSEAAEEIVTAADSEPQQSGGDGPADSQTLTDSQTLPDSQTLTDSQPLPDSRVPQQMADTENEATQQPGQMYDVQPAENGAFYMDEGCVDVAAVRQLSEGFLHRFLPTLERSQSALNEILNNQTVVMETLEQENAKFKDCTAHLDLSAMMLKAKTYHGKLVNIKRDMTSLHDKAAKLKKRALKLQQQKQKEELQRAHQQERELEKEQMLTARVASPDTSA